jgi:hypothetical protein
LEVLSRDYDTGGREIHRVGARNVLAGPPFAPLDLSIARRAEVTLDDEHIVSVWEVRSGQEDPRSPFKGLCATRNLCNTD